MDAAPASSTATACNAPYDIFMPDPYDLSIDPFDLQRVSDRLARDIGIALRVWASVD
jgi:hypothetical protein